MDYCVINSNTVLSPVWGTFMVYQKAAGNEILRLLICVVLTKKMHRLKSSVISNRKPVQRLRFGAERISQNRGPTQWGGADAPSSVLRSKTLAQGEFISPEHFNRRRVKRLLGAKPKNKTYSRVLFSQTANQRSVCGLKRRSSSVSALRFIK